MGFSAIFTSGAMESLTFTFRALLTFWSTVQRTSADEAATSHW